MVEHGLNAGMQLPRSLVHSTIKYSLRRRSGVQRSILALMQHAHLHLRILPLVLGCDNPGQGHHSAPGPLVPLWIACHRRRRASAARGVTDCPQIIGFKISASENDCHFLKGHTTFHRLPQDILSAPRLVE